MGVSKSRILVADPDKEVRETLKQYFQTHGHEVRTIGAAHDILKTARPWQPHAILVSAEFTEVSANQVCRDILDDTLTSHIPVVMILDIDDRDARLAALEAGVGDIVAKPFDLEELRLRVEASVRLSTTRLKRR